MPHSKRGPFLDVWAVRITTLLLSALSTVALANAVAEMPVSAAAPTNEGLAALVNAQPDIRLSHVRNKAPIDGVARQLVSFEMDGLKQYALVLRPPGKAPAQGWPLLIYNHGFHPDPPVYGKRTADGVDDRPGDYYRGMREA